MSNGSNQGPDLLSPEFLASALSFLFQNQQAGQKNEQGSEQETAVNGQAQDDQGNNNGTNQGPDLLSPEFLANALSFLPQAQRVSQEDEQESERTESFHVSNGNSYMTNSGNSSSFGQSDPTGVVVIILIFFVLGGGYVTP